MRMALHHAPRFADTDQALLEQIIDRVGVELPVDQFVQAVQRAFLASRERSLGSQLVQAFRECPSFEDFRGALAQALNLAPANPSILVIGASPRVPGRDSAYASAVAREVFGAAGRIERLDLEPGTIYNEPDGRFDIVVTHSLCHYFFDQEAFLGFIRESVRRGGVYVMGNEPNRRFWTNTAVQQAYREMDRSEARRRAMRCYLNPMFHASRVRTMLGGALDETNAFERRVNLMLRQELNAGRSLTLKEMNRITDPFFPDELPGDHPLGGNGLDWEKEIPARLEDFGLEWIASARHLGKQNPRNLPAKWQRANAELASRFPADGNVFSAVWQRVGGR